ncbi:MAG: hypothetical protein A2928_03430 [Candidatus Taylorbacteria bacterium RIFCSPLOWO2_01_FULL_45_15b]|uniref:O-antigen ligase-related domain-containing protein n=1 Tax=Candidatus Taylorbacteria bacterium RIFCSPLOWO2_01_FULL_45_15b TaxID=1802319 RepID=A0A1G2NAY7_9BACT|nr:MAG: hypothetical protein A2928_03430 [Candidatus Taylorbacteria bacterium RIFCSPLOWO2_01_FULL_45_15b]
MNSRTTSDVAYWIVLGGIFLLPFIPFIVSYSQAFPFITGKNEVFRLLVEIITAAWLILCLYREEYRPRQSKLFFSVSVFLGIIFIADLLSPNIFKSFWSNFERMEGFVTIFHLALYFFVAGSVMLKDKLWMNFWRVSLAASAIMAIYGFLQLNGDIKINQGGVRLDATFGNAIYLAVYMMFHVFMGLFLIVKDKAHRISQVLYGVVIIMDLIILYFTATRGAMLGLLFGLLVACITLALAAGSGTKYRKYATGGIIALVVLGGLFYSVKDTEFVRGSLVLSRIASISLDALTPRTRVWEMAWKGFQDRPILGWGQESFNFAFNKYYNPEMYTQEQWFDRTHNIIFDWLIAGGILGLLAYLSILYFAFRGIWKVASWGVLEKSIMSGLLAGYFFQNLTVFDNITSYILFFSILALIHSKTLESREVVPKFFDAMKSQNAFATPAIVILLIASVYFVNYKTYAASTTLIQAIQPQTDGAVRNLELFEEALRYNRGRQEIVENLTQTSYQIARATLPDETKKAFYDSARRELQRLTADVPRDARYELFFGSFLNRFNQVNDAIVHLDKAHELSPKKQIILFELGATHINKGEFAKGAEILKKAYDLAPQFKEAAVLYSVALVYAGDIETSDEILKQVYGDKFPDDDRLVNAYVHAKANERVVAFWKNKIEFDPDNAQLHVSLAAAYLNINARNQAIAELQKAIELNPEFKEQAENLIKEIRAGRNPQ